VVKDDIHLSFYIQTSDDILQGWLGDGDVVRIFVDSDVRPETGYAVSGIGSDYLIEVYGNKGKVLSSNYYEYDITHRSLETRGQHDWNGWSPMYAVDSAAKGNQLEVQLWADELSLDHMTEPWIIVQIADPLGNEDLSPVFSQGGSIHIGVSDHGHESMTSGETYDFLSLSISSAGEVPVTVQSIEFGLSSTATHRDIEFAEFVLDAGSFL